MKKNKMPFWLATICALPFAAGIGFFIMTGISHQREQYVGDLLFMFWSGWVLLLALLGIVGIISVIVSWPKSTWLYRLFLFLDAVFIIGFAALIVIIFTSITL